MAEIAPGGGGPNRLFVVLAVGLAGLLVIGLLGVGGILLSQMVLRAPPPTVRAQTTPTRLIALATPTEAPTEAPTPTLVAAGSLASPTAAVAGTPASGQLPQSGLGEDLMVLAGGVVLVLIVFAARRARTA